MLLDVGNSAIKWTTEKDGILEPVGRFYYRETGLSRAAEQAWREFPAPAFLAVVSVAGGDVECELSAWTARVWGVTPHYIRASKQAAGVTNGYVDPERLGADRWAAMVAARHATDRPLCVIDCGTAITLDVVDAGGSHQGGLIAPGIEMMRRSLVKETAAIGPLQPGADTRWSLLSRNTTDGVNNGVLRMAGALIDRVIEEADEAYDGNVEAVITGGDAARLLPVLRRSARHDRDLVLKGVAILAGEMLCGK